MKLWLTVCMWLILIAGMSACAQTPSTPLSSATVTPHSTGVYDGKFRAIFTDIIPGKMTETEVVELLGPPTRRYLLEAHSNEIATAALEYKNFAGLGGWIWLENDVVFQKSVFAYYVPVHLDEIIQRYGDPEQVIIRLQSGTDGLTGTAFLLYPSKNLAFQVHTTDYSFTPESLVWVGEELAPGYFERYFREQGLDGKSSLIYFHTEVQSVPWRGYVTPVP